MWFSVITLFPEMFQPFVKQGIISKGFISQKVQLQTLNPRDFVVDNYRRVDDRPYGGGAGMVMMAQPLSDAIQFAKNSACEAGYTNIPVVYMSPQGIGFSEQVVQESLHYEGLIILCGRYDGIDERVITKLVDYEWSIGDYVLSGGELPAMVVMDALIRKLPDILGDKDSVTQDSFVDGLLDYPQYTKPINFAGHTVPDVLRSGNHANIKKWRFLQQYKRTQERRPDLIEKFKPNAEQSKWLDSFADEK